MHKIAFIGAGSFGFTRGLVRDLLTYPAFRDAELALMDIDPQRLAWIEKAVRRIVNEGGYPATVTATLNRREALAGASGVISTILIGGLPVFRGDLEIPMKYGVNFCVGDTRGVPAIFRFLRTGPVLLSICEDIRELCPNAVFLNYSNPMSMNCMAMQRLYPELKVTGLCHSVQGTAKMLAKWIGAEEKRVSYVCAGINHQAFYTRFCVDGEDAYPALRKAVLDNPEIYEADIVRNEVFLALDYYVTESSGHYSEYVPWFRTQETSLERFCYRGTGWNPGHPAASVQRHSARYDSWEEETKAWFDKPLDLARGQEYATSIFNAVFGDHTPFVFNGNVLNTGLIPNLPQNCCVEVPVYASETGLTSMQTGPLPAQLVPAISASACCEMLAVEALVQKSRRLVYQAALSDPLTSAVLDPVRVRQLTDELLSVNRDWIDPGFTA